ncbi:MAG: Ig-like domain-containing protein [Prevotellaceae bacterium]|jgi:uncharacterized protein YggU (UPF0235/DUF167 family)|nr:Ig-like domain-containing protein [Prevotellaceae bacterium]
MRNIVLWILMIIVLFSCSASANVEPNTLKLDKSSISIQIGETERLYVLDITNVEGALVWSSSNTGIARVSDFGLVSGISPGAATITVKTRDDKYAASCMVIVSDKIPDNTLKLNKSSISIQIGETERLYALDITYVEGALVWSSSNTDIVRVSDYGLVSGISPGTATITAKTRDDKYAAFCIVIVSDKPIDNKPGTIKAEEALGGKTPTGAIFGNNGELLIYKKFEGLYQEKIILKAEDLSGSWSIKDYSPKSNYGWSASFVSATNAKTVAEISKIAVTFTKEITDAIEVTVESGLGEEKLFPIVFTAVNTSNNNSNNNNNNSSSNSSGGCNALFGLSGFALLFALLFKHK